MENNSNQSVNQPVTPVENIVPDHPVTKQKNFLPIILGILVFLVVIGSGAYFFGTRNNNASQVKPNIKQSNTTPTVTSKPSPSTETPANTPHWKEYKDNKYGFSFFYPPEWKYDEKTSSGYPVEQLKNGSVIQFGPMDDKNHIGEPVQPFINARIIYHVYNAPDMTIENLLLEYPDTSKISKQMFNDIPVTIVEHTEGLAGGYDVLIKEHDMLIIIEAGLAHFGSDTELYGKGVLEKMLNSFKVIN